MAHFNEIIINKMKTYISIVNIIINMEPQKQYKRSWFYFIFSETWD